MKRKFIVPTPDRVGLAARKVIDARKSRATLTIATPQIAGIAGALGGALKSIPHPAHSASNMGVGYVVGAAIGAIGAIKVFKKGTQVLVKPALKDYSSALRVKAKHDATFRKHLMEARAAGYPYLRVGRGAKLYPARTDPQERKIKAFRGVGFSRFKIDDILSE